MVLNGVDIIFVPSAAPNDSVKRLKMWKKYLAARAYDNRVNVAAVNLLFVDGGGGMVCFDKDGDTMIEYSGKDEKLTVSSWMKQYTIKSR